MLRLSFIALGLASALISATSGAQQGSKGNTTVKADLVAGGAYGTLGSEFGQAKFVIYRLGDNLIVEDAEGKREHSHKADGSFVADGGSVLRIVSPSAIEYSAASGAPVRLVRLGDAGSWEDYATRVNLGLIEYYKRKTAELQAQRAAAEATYEAPEPSIQRPMGAAFLDELNAMNRQLQAENERSRRQLEQTIANAQRQDLARRAGQGRQQPGSSAATGSPGAYGSQGFATADQPATSSAPAPKARQCTSRSFSQTMSNTHASQSTAQSLLQSAIAMKTGANITGSESVVSMTSGSTNCSQRSLADPMKRPPVGNCLACITENQAIQLGYVPGQGWPAPKTEWVCKAVVQVVAEKCGLGSSAVSSQ